MIMTQLEIVAEKLVNGVSNYILRVDRTIAGDFGH